MCRVLIDLYSAAPISDSIVKREKLRSLHVVYEYVYCTIVGNCVSAELDVYPYQISINSLRHYLEKVNGSLGCHTVVKTDFSNCPHWG